MGPARPLLGLLLAGALAGCAEAPRVTVHFAGEPDDALVTVDDQYVGKLGRLKRGGVGLRPGTHRVTVEQVGYFPHDVLVEVEEAGPEPRVEVELQPVPD